MNIQFRTKNFALTSEDKLYIEKKMESLEKMHQEILSTKIDVELQAHHKKGDILIMRVHVKVPHEEIVNIEERSTVREAIDIIATEMRTQLEKHKGKIRDKNLRAARLKRS